MICQNYTEETYSQLERFRQSVCYKCLYFSFNKYERLQGNYEDAEKTQGHSHLIHCKQRQFLRITQLLNIMLKAPYQTKDKQTIIHIFKEWHTCLL
jgi:hypothetical protein